MLYFLCSFFCHLLVVEGTLAATHLIVTHVGPCEDRLKPILALTELTITTRTYASSLTGQFNITEDVEDGWSAMATMQKCKDIRNTDTCDLLSSFRVVTDGCRDDKADLYKILFHFVTPVMECPIRAGAYKLTNYPLFSEQNYLTASESKISTSVFGYTFKLEGLTVDKRKLFCVEAYMKLLYMRDHNWLGRKDTTPQTVTTPKQDEEEE